MQEEHNTKRKYLLISTLPKDATVFETVHNELSQYVSQLQTISTNGMKISHCIGCNDCWIKTPGLCCIKDDYEQILIKMLQVDCVIFLTETKLGFVCSQMKNLVDRILPLATMHLKFEDGQMRHYSRYKKQPDMALLYAGSADKDYMSLWLNRVQINLHGRSLGAYEAEDRRKLYYELTNN
ncbi:MAG: hypothetical protein K0S01_3506 [Herbinix sp.]|jgi:multimeric flavodoxin WrbA|nr:hypothetical protein [Herbinix sp.]